MNTPPPPLVADDAVLALALRAWILECARDAFDHDMRNIVQSLRSGLSLLSKTTSPGAATRIDPGECIGLLRKHVAILEDFWKRVVGQFDAAPAAAEVLDPASLFNQTLSMFAREPALVALAPQSTGEHRVLASRASLQRMMAVLLLLAADSAVPESTIQAELNESLATGATLCLDVRVTGYPHAGRPEDSRVPKLKSWIAALIRMREFQGLDVVATAIPHGVILQLEMQISRP